MSQAALKPQYISEEEHQRIEAQTGVKYEWYDGEIFAMAGAALPHNRIAMNISASLHTQLLNNPCEPLGSDQQVKNPTTRSVMYPDVVIACPPHQMDERHKNALLNPHTVIEVASQSTSGFDRTGKFDIYAQIASLQNYILVASDFQRIEHFARHDDGWLLHVASQPDDCIALNNLQCRLCLTDVYHRLDLPFAAEFFQDDIEAE